MTGRTLREAHEAIEKIVDRVARLLNVAAIDVDDAYDDDTLIGRFARETLARAHRTACSR